MADLTCRPALWRRRRFYGPREWHGWDLRLLRVGPWIVTLQRETRRQNWVPGPPSEG